MKWTKEQQLVIDARNKDILVSAAAGSGKTAVLVERILGLITDEKHPIDIDRLLVVTFTNSAASEMRGRIRDALEKKAEADPENDHLQRQLVLVHNAKITTIHSFCLHVLRNHFQTIGIDPAFRIADQGEVLLLEQEVVHEIVNEAYESIGSGNNGQSGVASSDSALSGAEFTEFLEQFATGRDDSEVEAQILQLYHFALGQPFPEEWLRACRAAYAENSAGKEKDEAAQLSGAGDESSGMTDAGQIHPAWLAFIESDTALRLADIHERLMAAREIAQEEDGPYPYEKALLSDLKLVENLESGHSFADYLEAFRSMPPFARLGVKKDEKISENKKQQVQAMRADCKDQILALREQYYYDNLDTLMETYRGSGAVIRVLTKLTEAFIQRLSKKKAEKNILDFGDMEHLALQALVSRDSSAGGALVPTAVAQEYAETFEEVMIDEYQDSNYVQELILSSVSGGDAIHNRFMVGDVKQSIYRFRLARPELFMEKYHRYPLLKAEEDSSEQWECRIDLHRNFRSRPQVLEAVNFIFAQIMTEPLGGVDYDSDAALYPGADFPEPPISAEQNSYEQNRRHSLDSHVGAVREEERSLEEKVHTGWYSTELLLLDGSVSESSLEASDRADSPADLRVEEAKMVGRRIRELVGTMPVLDKESREFRPARYGDIVILLRTVSGWAETFGEVFADMGIPSFTGSQKGYFSAAEVRVVLSYLQILDNPRQDIPLAAVLRSAIGQLTDEELARIRIVGRREGRKDGREEAGLSFYDCCRLYMRDAPVAPDKAAEEGARNPVTLKKLQHFFNVYEMLRAKSGHTPVHQLLWELLDVTGYGEYAAALPAGRQRTANLDMLVEKAIAYEATSYRGLYHFVRYIENLQKYEVDYGEANIGSEADDTVRIMSIHKSKGLEFPIVFVSGMGKQFNETDVRGKVVMHPDWGIACDYVARPSGTKEYESANPGEGDPSSLAPDGDELPRMRQPTLLKKAIQQRLVSENLGEELRVLYVAMTRAKEKLILTGAVRNLAKKLLTWKNDSASGGGRANPDSPLGYSILAGASTYLDWVVPALLRHPDGQKLTAAANAVPAYEAGKTRRTLCEAQFDIRVCSPIGNAVDEAAGRADDRNTLQELLRIDPEVCQDERTRDYLEQIFSTGYPYESSQRIPGKLTVSELKKMSQTMEEADAEELYPDAEAVVPLIPRYMVRARSEQAAQDSSEEGLREDIQSGDVRLAGADPSFPGAARGTIYHTFMENLDFSKKQELRLQLEELISCGKMTREEAGMIRLGDISAFLRSGIGQKMERAARENRLYRESPFVLGVPAEEIYEDPILTDRILVQGIIDAWFVENGSITIVDYKTDRVVSGEVLVKRYRTQMEYYTKALERLTGMRVQNRVIYSFCLRKEIFL